MMIKWWIYSFENLLSIFFLLLLMLHFIHTTLITFLNSHLLLYLFRYFGMEKKKGCTVGLKNLTEEHTRFLKQRYVKLGNNLFMVPSLSSPDKIYMVDMVVGRCECPVGLNGSPCKHQYFLWSNNIADSLNFIPRFNKEERKKFVEIAYGHSLPVSFYESLHQTDSRIVNNEERANNDENSLSGDSPESTTVNVRLFQVA